MTRIACAALLVIICPAIVFAQIDLQNKLPNPVRFSGEIGSFGELYTVNGRDQRRPSSTGRLYVRSSLQFFNTVTVKLDLLYSTETGSSVSLGSSGRQSLNQVGLAPEWRWGKAYVGSFYDTYSPLTYDGVGLRGAGFNINPGFIRLAAFSGRAQSAVSGGAVDGAYQRRMSGGRIGWGRQSENGEIRFVDLVFIRTADDPASLPAPVSPADDASSPQTVNAYAVTPEENVVVAAVARIPVLQERVIVSGEVAASMHSRDRRAPVLSDEALDEYSRLLRSFITPRASTYGDIAHNGQVELRNVTLPGGTEQSPRVLSASLGYKYVGAGYVSLGVSSLPADQRALNARAALRFRNWNASVQGMLQEDNVHGQKLATTTRNRFALTASFRPTRVLSSSVRASLNTMDNDTEDADQRIDYSSVTFGFTQSLSLAQGHFLRTIALNWGYQQSADGNPLRVGNQLRAHDAGLRATFEASRSITVIPGLGVSFSDVGETGWTTRQTYSLAAQHRTRQGRLSSTLSLSNSRLHEGGSLQTTLSSRYRLTESDMVSLSLRSNRVTGLETSDGFHEHTMSVQWSRTIR